MSYNLDRSTCKYFQMIIQMTSQLTLDFKRQRIGCVLIMFNYITITDYK